MRRHFGTDVLECFHLELRRSHPGLYRAEWVLDNLTTCTHLIRVPVEPRLHYIHNSGAKSKVAG